MEQYIGIIIINYIASVASLCFICAHTTTYIHDKYKFQKAKKEELRKLKLENDLLQTQLEHQSYIIKMKNHFISNENKK